VSGQVRRRCPPSIPRRRSSGIAPDLQTLRGITDQPGDRGGIDAPDHDEPEISAPRVSLRPFTVGEQDHAAVSFKPLDLNGGRGMVLHPEVIAASRIPRIQNLGGLYIDNRKGLEQVLAVRCHGDRDGT
jgi:hypothetical protein